MPKSADGTLAGEEGAPIPERPPRTARSSDRRSDELAILNRIARIASEDLELQPMLQRITDAIATTRDWELVALLRLERDRSRFVCEAVSSRVPTAVAPGYARPLGSGVVGAVAASGRPILLDDVSTFPGFVEILPATRAELCLPVRHRDQMVAILDLESSRPAAFHGELPFFETVAEQIAGVIASARLYEEVRRRASDLEVLSEVSRIALEASGLTLLLDRIVAYVRERFEVSAAILLTSEDGSEFEFRSISAPHEPRVPPRSSWPATTGIVGRAIRTGEAQLVPDVSADPDYFAVLDGTAAELAIPIRHQGATLGAFNLEADDRSRFSEETVRVLRTVAGQIAGAIHLAAVNRRLAATSLELADANRRLQEANEALQRLSLVDGLTGVANRRCFDDALSREWRRARRRRAPLSLLLVDIDRFKPFNDAHGHQRGDAALRTVAEQLAAGVQRAGEVVARYGGEEFGVVLPHLDSEEAVARAEALRKGVEALQIHHGGAPRCPLLTVSVGVASAFPGPRRGPEELLRAADRALYRAKRDGRNRVAAAPTLGG